MATMTTEMMPSASLHSYSELLADISKFANLSGFENQELLGALDKGSFNGRDILHSLTRKQLKNYLNFRTGVEKTFTSYSKCKLIDRLVKTLMVNNAISINNVAVSSKSSIGQCFLNVTRRLRKGKHPTRLPTFSTISTSSQDTVVTCKNVACRAKISTKDAFCKRCSCCLCHKFDDNKDPSLWIVCEQDSASNRRGCGQSCHLECALKRRVAGVLRIGQSAEVDGGYCCQSCGNISELLGCWKKQLVIAKEARRIDVLCHRLSLAHRLLQGTLKYNDMHVNVHIAALNLEDEIGPFSEASSKLVRGIVSRLSVASVVQKNIEKALTNLELFHLKPKDKRDSKNSELPPRVRIQFQQVSSTSFTITLEVSNKTAAEEIVEHEVWHCKVNQDFGNSPTFSVRHKDWKEVLVSDLEADTEYLVRVVSKLKNGIAVENVASCLTKGIEQRNGDSGATASFKASIAPSNMVGRTFYELDGMDTTFKVRDIGRILKNSASAAERSAKSKFRGGDNKDPDHLNLFKSSNPADSKPADSNNNELENSVDLSAETLNFKERGMKQKLSQDLSDLPFRPCSNIKSCKFSLLLEDFPVHTSAELDPANKPQNRPFLQMPQDHLMVDKFPVATDICSFVYVQEPKQTEADIFQLKCSLPDMVANASQCLSIDQFGTEYLNHTRQNGHSVRLIIHPDVDSNDVKLESVKKTRKRLAPDHQRLSNKLDYTSQQGFSSQQRFHEVDFEYCVTVIRWLERQGQVGAHFRKRFLSWLGVRATDQQKGVIDAYIKVMISDPESLAEQLIDTYEEIISMTRQKVVLYGQ
ncbi:hypothetical protein O6H91_Y009300 [Diphasiastrum complanatum]|nr:hypothetical protein O6H91_Y009300 [Diphasiastrum complanatum]KAJ7298225.1 hypothetical protein O6H91_Y009300 [Diphasiastrum complanatum]KAJ7298226.1 hypothetical protein O6H91_Y009300 [Diphasiastrum complanatum]KAJ7298227.1 hypothetical protein O6H91_Y009300 [Diphasiastrum complanatum]